MGDKLPGLPSAAMSPANPGFWEAVSIDTNTASEVPLAALVGHESRSSLCSCHWIQNESQRHTFYFKLQTSGNTGETESCDKPLGLCNYRSSTILLTIKMKTCQDLSSSFFFLTYKLTWFRASLAQKKK